jgi:hypothetical protein
MPQGREIVKTWGEDAIRELGGSAPILEICKKVWHRHEHEIRQIGDLLYEWQYELRWAGDILRREGVIRPADSSPRGVWELS